MDFIVSPQNSHSQNSRVKTLQVLAELGLPHLSAKVITLAAFSEYYQEKKITPKLSSALIGTIKPLLEGKHWVSIRAVARKELGPLMPRSESLPDLEHALKFIKKTWDFFIRSSKDPLSLDVELLVHRFIPSFAAGTIDVSEDQKMIVEAIFGIWEGLQSNLHDVYLIEKGRILQKIVPEKDCVLLPTASGKWRYKKAPRNLRTKQVLSDEQIKEVSRQAQKVEGSLGPSRIEFILKETKPQFDKKAIMLWHIAPLKIKSSASYFKVVSVKEKTTGEAVYTGFPVVVEGLEDIKKLETTSQPKTIVFLGRKIIAKRDLFTIQLVGRIARKMGWPVVYKGGLLTHINIVLREYGVKVFSVNREVRLDKEVKIVSDMLYN